MKNKTILITGSTDGIGKQTALELASMGAHVLVHGRNLQRCQQAVEDIRQQSGNPAVEYLLADLSSLAQVHTLAADVQQRTQHLDVLINNAGVFYKERTLSGDGYEMTFAVNHLAHFLLTNLLLPHLQKAEAARIVTVSSMLHKVRDLDLNDLHGEKQYSGRGAYTLSKLGNILMTYELAERLAGSQLTANCLHPGAISTKLLRIGFDTTGDSLQAGASTPVYLASAPEMKGVNGKYFVNRQPIDSAEQTYDRELQKEFWRISARLTGVSEE